MVTHMAEEKFSRTAMLLGEDALERLAEKRVAVFGIGGVGGYVVEALVRSGIGAVDIIDKDEVSESNINRQIIATVKTIGQKKVDVMEQRIADVNPACRVKKYDCFYLPQTADQFDFSQYDYVVDAVDTVTAKLEIIARAKAARVPVISSMGAGNKLDPTRFAVADISKTSVCPLARVMRRELKKRGISDVKVVYSTEEAISVAGADLLPEQEKDTRRAVPGSIAFVPSVAGLILAGEVIKDLAEIEHS